MDQNMLVFAYPFAQFLGDATFADPRFTADENDLTFAILRIAPTVQ